MNLVLPTPLEPLLRSFSTNSKMQGGVATRPAHGSCALVKEVNNAGFVDLVTDGEHMVAVRNIESPRARNQRSQGLRRSCHRVFGTDGHQNRRADGGDLPARQGLPRSPNAGGERLQVGLRLLCKCAKQMACGIVYITQRGRLERVGDAFRQTDAFNKPDAKPAEDG